MDLILNEQEYTIDRQIKFPDKNFFTNFVNLTQQQHFLTAG